MTGWCRSRNHHVHRPVILNLLAGSMAGAWVGCRFGGSAALRNLVPGDRRAMLVVIAVVLLLGHDGDGVGHAFADRHDPDAGWYCCRLRRSASSPSLLGVAGGELLIPTLVLLFGADLKLAGSLSLAVSLPTMLGKSPATARARASTVLGANRTFVLIMAAGSSSAASGRAAAWGRARMWCCCRSWR